MSEETKNEGAETQNAEFEGHIYCDALLAIARCLNAVDFVVEEYKQKRYLLGDTGLVDFVNGLEHLASLRARL